MSAVTATIQMKPFPLPKFHLSKRVAGIGLVVAALLPTASFLTKHSESSAVSALKNVPGLPAAQTSTISTSMSNAGLVLPAGLTVHAITKGMTPTMLGDIKLFENTAKDADVAIQPLADGSTRVLNIIRSAAAPTAFTYDFPVPTGGKLALQADGGVAALDARGAVVNQIPAPWAMDANQNPVASKYSVSGSTIKLNVAHSAVNAYPVVADPCFRCFFRRVGGGILGGATTAGTCMAYGGWIAFGAGLAVCAGVGVLSGVAIAW